MIEIKGVSKTFGDTEAVKNLSMTVNSGEIFGFLGPNGAGKTTTIKMIVGINEIDSGTIKVEGIDVSDDPILSKSIIAYVPDNPDIYENMTGLQYINFISDIFDVSTEERNMRMKKYAEIFEITDALSDLISTYSHGMKQKIVLIGALVHDPEVLILDEPMVGLDPKSSFELKNIMRERADSGKTVFFSTHVMEVAEKLCDRIGIIKKGELIAIGTLDEIKKQAEDEGSLEKIFLELTEQ